MGGWSVYPVIDGKVNVSFNIYANLPTRIEVLEALEKSRAIDMLEVTRYCRFCLTFFVKRESFLSALRKALEWNGIERLPSAKAWITFALNVIESWTCDELYVRDDFMICLHDFIDVE